MGNIDYSILDFDERKRVEKAINNKSNFYGYIPEKGFEFIMKNYQILAKLGVLEESWITAYIHSSNFSLWGLNMIKSVFDVCSKNRLQDLYPIPSGHEFSGGLRYTLFRGCAGPNHEMGMSWCDSLDKAIWYATQHARYNDLNNFAVYVTTVSKDEIYCTIKRNENEFILLPEKTWKIDIPMCEFTLDRKR